MDDSVNSLTPPPSPTKEESKVSIEPYVWHRLGRHAHQFRVYPHTYVGTLVHTAAVRVQLLLLFVASHVKRLVFANEETIVHDDPPLSLCKKLTFAVGSMPYAMCNTVLGFYMTIFLLEVVIVSEYPSPRRPHAHAPAR